MRTWLETGEGAAVEIRGTLTLGRASSSGLQVAEDDVSRRHALIHNQGGAEYWLVDLGSRNGTLLNGQRVTQPSRLRNGDILGIGTRRFVFRRETDAVTEATCTSTKATVCQLRVETRVLLLADLVGFTGLSQRLPPDQLAGRVGAWLSACRDLVQDSDGSINKYLGDGFFATWPASTSTAIGFGRLRVALRELQRAGVSPFRFVVHVGSTTVDSSMVNGEETLLGAAVNYVFRMEKIASKHDRLHLWSGEAATFFAERIAFAKDLESEVPGFPGVHPFFLDLESTEGAEARA